jgi:hypothetical protein
MLLLRYYLHWRWLGEKKQLSQIAYFVAIIDWYSRYVLSWRRIEYAGGGILCLEALNEGHSLQAGNLQTD